jgi:hypothetical protein
MKKSTRAVSTFLYQLLFLIASGWLQQAMAQTLPFPVASYPLYMDKYRQYNVIQPWDISGNARHGNTYDPATQTFYDAKFERDSFPNNTGIPCVNKPGADAVYITIPNPYPQYTSSSSYTICFWVYWRSDMAFTDQTVIKTPDLEIRLNNSKIYLGINGSHSLQQYSSTTIFNGEGWYFIVVASSHLSYTRKYQGTAYTSELEDENAGAPYSQNFSQILDASFRGKIALVKFYDDALTTSQLDALYQEDLNWALHTYTANDVYVKKNMYAYYPLDGGGFNEFKKDAVTRFGNRDALSASGVTPAPDRFGNSNHALSFPQLNAYMQLPPFFGDYLNDYVAYNNNKQKGFTISYWMYISPAQSSPSGGIGLPFTDSDPRQKIFYGAGGGNNLFGMQKIVDRLGIFRYNDIVANSRYPWYLWLYDPLSFRAQEGWFQVIWVQYADWLRMYLFKPDGSCACQSIYLGIQDLSAANITEWGLGYRGGPSTSQDLRLDDFRIYNWPLRTEEVCALRSSESSGNTPCTICAQGVTVLRESTSTKKTTTEDTTAPLPDKGIQVFPNPANDQLTIRLPLKANTAVQVTLLNTEGKTVYKRQYTLQKGIQQIQLDHLNLLPGSYFIRLEGNNLHETRQVIIQK